MSNTSEVIYRFVCENPGLSTYEISKKLNMSGGKVRYVLTRLYQMGIIGFKFQRFGNPRIRKLTYSVPAFKLVPKSLKRELNKLKV